MRNKDDTASRLCYLSGECFPVNNIWRVKTEGDYIIMTQAKCNFYDICREVIDSEYPELKAMINRNENIRFFASYIFRGNVRYDYLGEFPTLSIDQARNKAQYLARSNEDETAYGYIPF